MGKLIDSDELKLRLKNLHLLATSGYGAEEVVKQTVDEMPEGVVRCKDCKHQVKTFHADKRMKNGGYYVYFCDLAEEYSHVCLDEDFCSKGERRDG